MLLLRQHLHLLAAALLVRWHGLRRLAVVDGRVQKLVHVLDQARERKVFVHFAAFELLLNFKFEFPKFLLDLRIDVPRLFQGAVRQLHCVQIVRGTVSAADHPCLNLSVGWLPCENDLVRAESSFGSILLIRLDQHGIHIA